MNQLLTKPAMNRPWLLSLLLAITTCLACSPARAFQVIQPLSHAPNIPNLSAVTGTKTLWSDANVYGQAQATEFKGRNGTNFDLISFTSRGQGSIQIVKSKDFSQVTYGHGTISYRKLSNGTTQVSMSIARTSPGAGTNVNGPKANRISFLVNASGEPINMARYGDAKAVQEAIWHDSAGLTRLRRHPRPSR